MKPNQSEYTLFCDGAARGNPGPGAIGFVILNGAEVVFEEGKVLGNVTNNVAEYEALIEGLKKSLELGVQSINIKSDSEVIVRQLNGIYKVKMPHLKVLFEIAKELLKKFKQVKIDHIPREQNKHADRLANQALDLKM
jgi:ribonuclease HI